MKKIYIGDVAMVPRATGHRGYTVCLFIDKL